MQTLFYRIGLRMLPVGEHRSKSRT